MDLDTITIDDFKARFTRDFNYTAPDNPDYVSDQDITNGFGEAQAAINQGLFSSDAVITLAYLLLTAHFVCSDLRAAAAGVWAPGAMPISSSGMGAASESYQIPEAYSKNPLLAMYTQTAYGMRYLQMALPNMTGNVVVVAGATQP